MEHALSFDKATKIWVPDPINIWILCDIISVNELQGNTTVKNNETNEIITIDLNKTQQYHPTHSEELDNLCTMNNFHEAPLIYSLRKRSLKNKIYTRIGDVLISVNPYKNIPGLYDHVLDYYILNQDSSLGDTNTLPPHIFQIANSALIFMLQNKNLTNDTNQSIIISGESGAGKTEASKKVIQFLIDVDNYLRHQDTLLSMTQQQSSTTSSITTSSTTTSTSLSENIKQHQAEETLGAKINRRIWESTYIFESFGNAKTIRNDNSSRFGKFIKLRYGQNNRLVTANAETFLLEKSRLTSISLGERNYHVFYQMLRGTHETLNLNQLNLTTIEDYQILLADLPQKTKNIPQIHGSFPAYPDYDHDANEFSKLCQALLTLGCSEDDMKSIWLLLSTILHLGNCYCISPTSLNNTNQNSSSSSSSIHKEEHPVEINSFSLSIDQIATNLGVSSTLLKRALTIRVIQATNRKSFSSKCLTEEETEYNIKALIKYLYDHLFQWLQTIINQSFEENQHNNNNNNNENENNNNNVLTKSNDERDPLSDITLHRYIGILDIFGFEIFEENSFEQLCINYANELLQKLFNDTIFLIEQEEYAREGIEWQHLEYTDNQNVIDLISKKPHGIFHALDAQCMLNRKTDDSALLSTFTKYHYIKPGPQQSSPHSNNKNSLPIYDIPKFSKNEKFIIRHFAGEVEYSIHGFLSKNNISLQDDVQQVIKQSNFQLIRRILHLKDLNSLSEDLDEDDFNDEFDDDPRTLNNTQTNGNGNGNNSNNGNNGNEGEHGNSKFLRLTTGSKRFAGQITVSYSFNEQINELLTTLKSTRTHYVKCLKPNNSKSNNEFNSNLILQQLKCNGIMELVRIKRQGYPTHSEFYNFVNVFSIILYDKNINPLTNSILKKKLANYYQNNNENNNQNDNENNSLSFDDYKNYCKDICEICLPLDMYQIGKNKVFLKDGFELFMREKKLQILNKKSLKIQTKYRSFKTHKNYLEILKKIISLQKWYRSKYYKKLYHKKLNYIIKIQSLYRMFVQHIKVYKYKLKQFKIIQKYYRKHFYSKRYQLIKKYINLIQNHIRIYKSKKVLKELKQKKLRFISCIIIQKQLRILRSKSILNKLKFEKQQQIKRELEEKRLREEQEAAKAAAEEAERIRLEKERQEAEAAEKARLEKEEQERLEKLRLEEEEAERIRLEKEAAEKLRLEEEERERQRIEAEKLEQERLHQIEEEKRIERERIEAERIENERLQKIEEEKARIRANLRQKAIESRILIEKRIAELNRNRAAILIQIFWRLKHKKIQKQIQFIVPKKKSKVTIKELVVETYCHQFIKNMKKRVQK